MAGSFNSGTPDYYEASLSPITAYPCSVFCRFNFATTSAAHQLGGFGSTTAVAQRVSMSIDDQSAAKQPFVVFAGTVVNAGDLLTYSTWTTLLGRCDGSGNATVTINAGTKGTSTGVSFPSSIGYVRIATRPSGSTGAQPYNGLADEFAFWNVELSDAEDAALANGYSPLLIRRSALKFYASLVRAARDLISGTTLTPSGSPAVAAHHRVIYPSRPQVSAPAAAAPGGTILPQMLQHGLYAGSPA